MRLMLVLSLFVLLAACAPAGGDAAGSHAPGPRAPDFAEIVDGLEKRDGFFDLYIDRDGGRVLAALPAPDEEDGEGDTLLRAVHAMRLASGLGSNPLGLDRGWGNSGEIIRFRRIGPNVVAEIENHRYRASSDDPAEKRAVAESFASSFVWAAPVEATAPDGRVLVDISSFLTTDFLGLAGRLSEGEARFSLAEDLSMPVVSGALAFPDNVEIDARLTFRSDHPGPEVTATAAYPRAPTLMVHHSFVRLPDDGYRPRAADPRVGVFTLGTYDYAAPLADEVLRGFAIRHRLQRADAADPESEIVEPIVFYVDPGAPEPIRGALVDGASWWAEAFAAAGFPDGFRVEILPEDAHPLDVRRNVIQWVHRQTRGWSYGGGVIDPRTGEYIKGHVILGSQRVRQDRMIFEGLAGVEKTGSGAPDDPIELSLARIRQLAAHEVGHALGFGHNFAASARDRSSVMDYPAPWVIATDRGGLDFSRAYDVGIGDWDKATAKWLYGEFAPEAEADALNGIVADARQEGLLFIADQHGRAPLTAHASAAVWDNGGNPVTELRNVMAVRRIALSGFDETRLAAGRPLADLQKVFTPIYLYHRYQVNAAAKSLGGVRFQYGRNGDDAPDMEIVSPAAQREALGALLETLAPVALDIPERVLQLMDPPADFMRFRTARETIDTRADPLFDKAAAVETAADLTFAALFAPARAERLVQFHARAPAYPSLEEVFDAVEQALFETAPARPRTSEIARLVRGRYVFALMDLGDADVSQSVKARVRARLVALETRFAAESASAGDEAAHRGWLGHRIGAYLARPAPSQPTVLTGPKTPPGSPIGAGGGASRGASPGTAAQAYETCWHCD